MLTTRRLGVHAAVVGLCTLLVAGAGARAQCVSDWIGGEQFPGVNGAVGAMLEWDPDGAGPQPSSLVVAGDFSMAGVLAAPRIAVWNGTSWSAPFGAGFDGIVRALTVFNGDLIAAGEFAQAGGTPAARIARWNGAAWLPLDAGIDGPVLALASFNGRLYAGGNFGHAGAVAVSGLASWDGAAWSTVGSMGVDGNVNVMSVFNNALYIGGAFTHADATTSPGVVGFDGAAYFALGAGLGVAPAEVRTMLVDGGYLYLGGPFTTAGGAAAYGVTRWNGSAFTAAGQGLYHQTCIRYSCGPKYVYPVDGLGRLGSTILAIIDASAGSSPAVFKFGGASWNAGPALPTAAALPGPIASVTPFNNALYVGGNFGGPGSAQNIARFDGAAWGFLTGMDGAVNALIPYSNGVLAVGAFTQADGVVLNHVGLWDGSAVGGWHAIGGGITTGVTGGAVAEQVTNGAIIGTDIYVGAWPGGVLHWDGSAWAVLYGAGAFGGPPVVAAWNNQIVCGAAFGSFTVPEGASSSIGLWSGAAWTPLGEFSGLSTSLQSMATLNNTLYAASYLGVRRITSTTGEWGSVGSSTLLGGAYSIVNHDGAIYASVYDSTDGITGFVKKLNGTTWQQLGGVFDAYPLGLASANGSLYAIGGFSTIDGVEFDGIARWDTASSSWQTVGAGAQGNVLTMAGLNGNLLAGGDFTSINGKGYSRFAVYGCIPAPACRADFDNSGVLTVQDIFDYLNAWFSGNSTADFDQSGSLAVADIFAYLNAWFSGCP